MSEIALPSTKTSRTNAVHFTPAGPGKGVIIVDQVHRIAEYKIEESPCDTGRAFRLTKLSGGTDSTEHVYDLFLPDAAHDATHWPECDCKGFQRHSHCKHLDAVQAVVDRGLVTPLARASETKPAKPVRLCSRCGKRPTDGIGYMCSECECGM